MVCTLFASDCELGRAGIYNSEQNENLNNCPGFRCVLKCVYSENISRIQNLPY